MSDLPQGWVSSKLGDLCDPSQYGYTAKAGSSGNIHFLRTTDITSGPIDWETVPYCEVDGETREKYLLHDGDVVISRAGSVGYSCLIRQPRPSVFASYLIRFRPRINADYFKYFLLTPYYWNAIGEQSLGIAVQNVNASKLAEIEVPVAPEGEQTRIVTKLDELLSDLDAGVAELKAAQKKLAQYRQSLLKAAVEGALTAEWREQNTPAETGAQLLERILTERRARWEAKQLTKFKEQGKAPPKDWQQKYPEPVKPDTTDLPELPEGWAWATIDQLSVVVRGASPRPAGDPKYFGGNIPWITVGSITRDDEMYLTGTEQFVTEAGKEASRYIEPNTLLLTNSGATLGVPKITKIGGCINDGSVALLDVDETTKRYLYWFLKTQTDRLRALNQGAAQPNLNTDIVRRITFPLCAIDEQEKIIETIAKAISAAKEQESSVLYAMKQSTAQRQNILRAAFTGQLVPQDSSDEPASALLERIRAERSEREKQPKIRKTKQQKEIAAVMSKLIDVLAEAGDWMPAQEAFRRCGVADSAQTDQIEALYAELRALDKAGRLAVEAVKDKKGRKLHDKLKLLAS